MKSLNTIQTFSKIGKILSKIVYICCIVGICGCVIGLIGLSLGANVLKLQGQNIETYLNENNLSLKSVYIIIVVGIILCIGELIVAIFAYKYFDNELEAGTPFSFDGAKEMLRLGILMIAIPFGTNLISQIVIGVFKEFFTEGNNLEITFDSSFLLGGIFIFMSIICKYGAEILNHQPEEPIDE